MTWFDPMIIRNVYLVAFTELYWFFVRVCSITLLFKNLTEAFVPLNGIAGLAVLPLVFILRAHLALPWRSLAHLVEDIIFLLNATSELSRIYVPDIGISYYLWTGTVGWNSFLTPIILLFDWPLLLVPSFI